LKNREAKKKSGLSIGGKGGTLTTKKKAGVVKAHLGRNVGKLGDGGEGEKESRLRSTNCRGR